MIRIILFAVVFCAGQLLQAQMQESSYSGTLRGGTPTTFATDYEAIGINPANLGFDNKYGFSIGIGELGYTFYSDALLRDDVRQIIFSNEDSITLAEQETVADAFLGAGLSFDLNVQPVGLSIRIPKVGTFGFSMQFSAAYHTIFKGKAAEIIFQGYNYADYIDTIIITPTEIYGVAYEPLSLSQLFEGTEIQFNAGTSYNLDYGRKIFGADDGLSLYGGIGIKYIASLAYLDINTDGNTINGIGALGLDLVDFDPHEISSPITSSPLQPVGKGWGFDIGATLKATNAFTVGASIIDIGSVKYTANLMQISDYTLDTIRFSGMTTTDPMQMLSDIFGVDNLIAYSGVESFDVTLPTKLRLGASLKLGETLDIGVDGVFPMNDVAGAMVTPLLGVGGQMTLLKVIKLSGGISAGGGYSYYVPAGIGLDFKLWELGLSTRDILTWFGEVSPNVSFAAAVLRFKI